MNKKRKMVFGYQKETFVSILSFLRSQNLGPPVGGFHYEAVSNRMIEFRPSVPRILQASERHEGP